MATTHLTEAEAVKTEDPTFFERHNDIELDNQETDELLYEKEHLDEEGGDTPAPAKKPSKLLIWIAINIIATTAIVFINKSIFDDPSFRGAQVSFATFHFLVTFATLHTVSSSRFGFFERKRAALRDILPLAGAMCLNVILPNLSLAYSSITFYQTARVLLTPITAFLNYAFYKKTTPRQAVCALFPVCAGVAMVTYFDVRPGTASKGTSFYGVVFALSGVLMSGIYTCWIGHYHQKLQMTSLQLLHNQSLIGGMLLIYLIPFVDTLPVFSEVPLHRWLMIIMVRTLTYSCIHKLTFKTERSLRMSPQPLSIRYHRWSRTRSQYSGGPLQDRHHRDSWLDLDGRCRQWLQHPRCRDSNGWHHLLHNSNKHVQEMRRLSSSYYKIDISIFMIQRYSLL
jgi:solute carrier family 35 protein E3